MGASTTQGTGHGSVTKLKPVILNGVVKDYNISRNALDMYEGYLSVDGSNEEQPIGQINGGLSIAGDLGVEGSIGTNGNVEADGYVRGHADGQLLNTAFYTFDNGVIVCSNTSFTDVASVSYTPVSATSKLLIEYHAMYTVSGSLGDSFRSRLTLDGNQLTWRDQAFYNGAGGGTRSGVLFPISMVYTNSNLVAKAIKAQAARVSADDSVSLDTTSAYLRISEYAR